MARRTTKKKPAAKRAKKTVKRSVKAKSKPRKAPKRKPRAKPAPEEGVISRTLHAIADTAKDTIILRNKMSERGKFED